MKVGNFLQGRDDGDKEGAAPSQVQECVLHEPKTVLTEKHRTVLG